MLLTMPFSVMLAIVLIGAGAVIAAVVGLLLPENHWVGVGLALVLGAGVGVVVLAIGIFAVGSNSSSGAQNAFLVAAAAGFVAVLVALSTLWKRVQAETRLQSA
jgi:hypothetical protein